ncbi:MAG: glycosyltransferase [Gemmiger sp.]
MAKLTACIVSYCDYDEVCCAVRSILAQVPARDFHLFVVDNASPDGCGERLAETDFGDGRVEVCRLGENVGFGRGHNSVLPRLDSEVHFILNPDIVLTEDVLTPLADWLLAHPDAVMATPQLYYPDGRIQHLPRRKPTPWLLLARQLAPRLGGIFQKTDAHYTMQDEDLSQPRRIEFCTGSFSAVRTEVFRSVGGFDEDYFMYVEDADLTQKMLQKGTVWLVPALHAVHAWHRDPMRDAGKFKMQLVSMGRYFQKWGIKKGHV